MSNELGNIVNMLESMDFVPSEVMMRAKARLLAAISDNPVYSLEDMSLDVAIEFTKERKLRQWWKQDGFQDWFKNKHEFRAEVEDLLNLGLKRMRTILNSESDKLANAQVSVVKMLMEAGNKMPKQKETSRGFDSNIDKMNSEQLEEFLKRAGYVKLAPPPEPIYIAAPSEDALQEEGSFE